MPAVPTGYTELDAALGADKPFNGKTVSVQTQWVGGEGTNFASSLADFAAATGIKIQVDSIGSSHETVLRTRIEGGQPPDLAMLAQPTPVLAYAADGKVIDVATFMDAKKLADEHPATIGLVTEGSNIWGIPYKADVKSTIWYPIKAFEATGYTVPTTWDELIALSDKIVADGTNPWCVSAGGPGDATGWQITDWVEEVVLKTKGLDYYNQWISHEIPFNDPGIKDAFDQRRPDLLHGQVRLRRAARRSSTPTRRRRWTRCSIRTSRRRSAGCRRSRPGTARTSSRISAQAGQPSQYVIGEDIGIFPFPTIDPAQTNAEGSADTLMVLADRPEVRAVAEFLATPEGIQRWIETGSAISANTTTPRRVVRGLLQAQGRVRDREQRGRDRLRRLRPHARRRRRRDVLDEGRQVGQQRWRRYRRHPEGHRRQLARQPDLLMAAGRSTSRWAPRLLFPGGGWMAARSNRASRTVEFILPIAGLIALGFCVAGVLVLYDPKGGPNLLASIYDALGNTRARSTCATARAIRCSPRSCWR